MPRAGDLLGERLRILAVKAVGRDRGGVDETLDAGRDGGLEHVARADEVHRRALPRAAHDDERQVHDDVGVPHQVRDGLAVEHVAAPVGDLLPAPLRGSNARRAMPSTRPTSRERSSAATTAWPISPVGPVTATVRPAEEAGRGAIHRCTAPRHSTAASTMRHDAAR